MLWWHREGDEYAPCMQRSPVQLSVSRAAPSHNLPPCLGSGSVHSLVRCLSHSELHTDHRVHSAQPPSTVTQTHTHTSTFETKQIWCKLSNTSQIRVYRFPSFSLWCSVIPGFSLSRFVSDKSERQFTFVLFHQAFPVPLTTPRAAGVSSAANLNANVMFVCLCWVWKRVWVGLESEIRFSRRRATGALLR